MMGPVTFIYAAERSGTTVFRLMLDAHPELFNPIESDFLFDHIRRNPDGSWFYDLDGLSIDRIFGDSELVIPDPVPDGAAMLADFLAQFRARNPGHLTINIHRNIGRAIALCPEAKVIHLLRDPRDVARSSIGMGWAGLPLYGVEKWQIAEQDWDVHAPRIKSGNVMALRYEDLIPDTEGKLREVCAFLGVDFDPVMLRYYENTTYDAPDPALIFQWRRKMAPADLALVEGRLGGLLESRGYEPSGVTPARPGPLTGAYYWIRNKLMFWRMSVARYGLGNVLAEKIGRRLGLKKLQYAAQRRINDIVASQLK